MSAAVFFDRDGVVNELVPDPVSGLPESPLDPEDVRLIPGAAAALRRLHDAGYLLVGISNQPAAAKGVVEPGALARCPGASARVAPGMRASPSMHSGSASTIPDGQSFRS